MQRILIIDDDVDILFSTRRLLKRVGYDVYVAQNGEEGLDLFNKLNFDLVITDMIMPQKEGIEVITELKKRDPAIKIVVISGGGHISSDFYLRAANQFHVDLALTKPFNSTEFVEQIRNIM